MQRLHPLLMIVGGGEQLTLRVVARLADACNVGGDPAEVARKFEILRRHCEAVERPFEAIEKTNVIGFLLARDEAALAAKRLRLAVPEPFGCVADTVPLTADDIAEAAAWVVGLPPHMNINRMEIMPTCQAPGPLAIKRA